MSRAGYPMTSRTIHLSWFSIFAVLMCSCAAGLASDPPIPAGKKAVKVDATLLALYDEYVAFIGAGGSTRDFQSRWSVLQVNDGLIVIEAIASVAGAELAKQLQELGAVSIAHYDRNVSCRLPILSIRDLPILSALRFANASYQITH